MLGAENGAACQAAVRSRAGDPPSEKVPGPHRAHAWPRRGTGPAHKPPCRRGRYNHDLVGSRAPQSWTTRWAPPTHPGRLTTLPSSSASSGGSQESWAEPVPVGRRADAKSSLEGPSHPVLTAETALTGHLLQGDGQVL